MRPTARVVLVLLTLLVAATISHCQQTSAVIAPQASVYSQASSKSRALRTVEQGQRVLVDMTISNSEGTWCLVREPETKEKPGYMPCSQLTSEALPKAVPTVPVFNPSEQVAGSAATADKPALSGEYSQYQQMLEASGLEALRADLAATLRRHGVTDNMSFIDRMVVAGKNPYADGFVMAAEPKIRRGGVRYKAFWKAYWSALTDEQKNLIAKREPRMILAYLQSQSEPESAFLGWVLASMRQSKKK